MLALNMLVPESIWLRSLHHRRSLLSATYEECQSMRIELVLAPVEDEEPHHRLVFEMPGVPQAGDCVTISRPDQAGNTEFIVRRTCWTLDTRETEPTHHAGEFAVGTTSSVTVECEFVAGPLSSEEHKRIAVSSPT
jgi:hypothetical protein